MGRPSRMPSGSNHIVTWRSALGAGIRACVLIAISSFAFDICTAHIGVHSVTRARGRGWLAGLGLALVLALVLGSLFGVLRALAARSGAPPAAGQLANLRAWLFGGDRALQRARVASLIGASWTVFAYALASFVATRAVVLGVAQPHFAAAVIVAAQLGLALCALALFPLLRGLADYVARLGDGVALRWLLGRPGSLVNATFALLAAVALFAGFKFWAVLQYLPFQRIGATLGAPLLAYAVALALRAAGRAGAAFERGALTLVAISCAGALLVFAGRGDELTGMRQTVAGQVGLRATKLALDFDHDGALNVLGGGDCAPFDARIGPLALDIPNDHLDQDCDGVDLDDKLLGPDPGRNFHIPKGFPRRPLILLLTVDAFAARHTGAFSYARNVTPRIDEYAKGGTEFRFTFSQGPSTRLSFPSIFTSRYDSQIVQRLVGGHPYPIDDGEFLLAELLTEQGYDTTAVISDSYFRKSRWGSLLQGFGKVVESALRGPDMHNSKEVTDAAINALEHRRNRPLFLWVHYYDAHSPHSQPPDVHAFGESREDLYDAELSLVDREAGRLLDYVETTFAGQAMVFITGDHGIAFDDARHGRLNYGYDLSSVVLHVPLIVRGPLVKQQVIDRIASTMDIAPTIANLLRYRGDLPFEGASLVPEIFDGTESRPQRLLHEFFLEERRWDDEDPLEQVSLRNERYSLVQDRKHGGYQLYDYRRDYYEINDLSNVPAMQPELTTMRQQLALLTYRMYPDGRPKQPAPQVAIKAAKK